MSGSRSDLSLATASLSNTAMAESSNGRLLPHEVTFTSRISDESFSAGLPQTVNIQPEVPEARASRPSNSGGGGDKGAYRLTFAPLACIRVKLASYGCGPGRRRKGTVMLVNTTLTPLCFSSHDHIIRLKPINEEEGDKVPNIVKSKSNYKFLSKFSYLSRLFTLWSFTFRDKEKMGPVTDWCRRKDNSVLMSVF